MNCVLHFENHGKAVDEFVEKHLGPCLEERGLGEETEIQWVPYSDPNDPQGPALDALHRINDNVWQRVVFVVDMDARGANTPQVRFGLDMLQHLAWLLYQNQPVPLSSLLSDGARLTCALSIFTPQFKSVIQNCWPQAVVNGTMFVEPDKDVKNIDCDSDRALGQSTADGLRMVVADRLQRGEWLATLIAKWL